MLWQPTNLDWQVLSFFLQSRTQGELGPLALQVTALTSLPRLTRAALARFNDIGISNNLNQMVHN